ncbi:MAG: hypothetical protein AAF927_19735 [Bacteroidota bacterium]
MRFLTLLIFAIFWFSCNQNLAQDYNKGRSPEEVSDDVFAGRVDEDEEPKQSLAEDMCECFANQDWSPLQSTDLVGDYQKIRDLLRNINHCEILVTIERPGYEFNFKNRDSVLVIAKQLCAREYQKIQTLVSLYPRAHDLKVKADAVDNDPNFSYVPAYPREELLTEPQDLTNDYSRKLLTHINSLATNYQVKSLYLGYNERNTCGVKVALGEDSPSVAQIQQELYQLKGQKSGYMTSMYYRGKTLAYIARSAGPGPESNVYDMDSLRRIYQKQYTYIEAEYGEDEIIGVYLFLRAYEHRIHRSTDLMVIYEGEDGIYQQSYFSEYIFKGEVKRIFVHSGPIQITPAYMSYRTRGAFHRADYGYRKYFFLTPGGDLVGTSTEGGRDISQHRFDHLYLKLY